MHKAILKDSEAGKIGDAVVLEELIPRSVKVNEDGYEGIPTIIKSPRTKVATKYASLADTWILAKTKGVIKGANSSTKITKRQ